MALHIKNPETEMLARELARQRRQSITAALTDLLRKEVGRERRRPLRPDDTTEQIRRIDAIITRFASRPVREGRSDDEVLGYNEQGVFD